MPDILQTTDDQRRRRELRMYPAICDDRELDIASLMNSLGFTRDEAERIVDRVYRDCENG